MRATTCVKRTKSGATLHNVDPCPQEKNPMHEQIDELDLEQFAKANPGAAAPAARTYKIRIDKTTVSVDKPILTGRELLALVDKTPEKFKLYEHIHGNQPLPISPDQNVDL